ncbi:MAG: TetR/AcrR family transcriptional regulator [Anaerolineae bacterium]
MPRKPGRPTAAQEPLSRERILQAALTLIDTSGVEALSMRRLAAVLGVDPMALYHYLPNKEAILRGLIELIFSGLQVPQVSDAAWEDQVRACARAYFDVVRAHPQLLVYIVGDLDLVMQAGLNANNEMLYAALFAAGLSARQVHHAASLVIDYLHGYLLAERVISSTGENEMIQRMKRMTTNQYPFMQRILAAIEDRLTRPYSVMRWD